MTRTLINNFSFLISIYFLKKNEIIFRFLITILIVIEFSMREFRLVYFYLGRNFNDYSSDYSNDDHHIDYKKISI